jgi:hypothetical protein
MPFRILAKLLICFDFPQQRPDQQVAPQEVADRIFETLLDEVHHSIRYS